MKIKIGTSNKDGDIYEDYEKAKSCHFCVHFVGYGLHAVCGKCTLKDKEIHGGYTRNYGKTAKECDSFQCEPELLKED